MGFNSPLAATALHVELLTHDSHKPIYYFQSSKGLELGFSKKDERILQWAELLG
jgi:hypothetical protein